MKSPLLSIEPEDALNMRCVILLEPVLGRISKRNSVKQTEILLSGYDVAQSGFFAAKDVEFFK